jgi:hypothetical protein
MSRSQNYFKGPQNLLHLSSCLIPSLLNNALNWSSMINLLPPLPPTYLCVTMIQRRMTSFLPLIPNITLPPRRKLTIYHLHRFNNIPQFHLPMVLFMLNDPTPIQSSTLLPRLGFVIILLILMCVLPKTIVLWRIWHKHHPRCHPSKSFRVFLHNIRHC